jgi:segregation and condensation protein B
MGDKLDIDEIITMEDGKAEVKKQKPKLKERLKKVQERLNKSKEKAADEKKSKSAKPKKSKSAPRKTKKQSVDRHEPEEQPEQDGLRKKDVKEIIKDVKPPSKDNMLSVLEASLFMSSRPLMLDELAKISGINSLGYLKQLLVRLQKDYGPRGMEIVNGRGGWKMQVRQHLLQHVAHLTPYSDVPEGCKRTLALIVYKEPMKQADLIRIQGNKAYTYIKELKKRGLVKTEKKSRTMLVKLTQEFERYFGDERKKIRDAMVKEFGDPAKLFPEPKKAADKEKDKDKPDAGVVERMKRLESAIQPIKGE